MMRFPLHKLILSTLTMSFVGCLRETALMNARSAAWAFVIFAIAVGFMWPSSSSSTSSLPVMASAVFPSQLSTGVNLPIERWDAH